MDERMYICTCSGRLPVAKDICNIHFINLQDGNIYTLLKIILLFSKLRSLLTPYEVNYRVP